MAIFTVRELLDQGVSRGAITYRTKVGTLQRLLPAVYSTTEPSYLERCEAVTRWRPDAVLSHLTAAWLWHLIDKEPDAVHCTVAAHVRVSGPVWVAIHRRVRVDATRIGDLSVVTMERTFVDVAATLHGVDLTRLFDTAIGTRLHWRRVADLCAREHDQPGIAEIRRHLTLYCPRTRTETERFLERQLSAAGCALEIEVDTFFGALMDRRARVIVDVDRALFPSSLEAFTTRHGWLVLRFAAAEVMHHDAAVVTQIVETVRRRRS